MTGAPLLPSSVPGETSASHAPEYATSGEFPGALLSRDEVEDIIRRNPKIRQWIEAKAGNVDVEAIPTNIDQLTDIRITKHVDSVLKKLKEDVLPIAKQQLEGIPEDDTEANSRKNLEQQYLEARRRAAEEVEAEFQAQKESIEMLEKLGSQRDYSRRNWVFHKEVDEYGEEVTTELGDMVYEYDSKPLIRDYLKRSDNVVVRNRINWKLRAVIFTICLIAAFLLSLYGLLCYARQENQYAFWASASNGNEFLKLSESQVEQLPRPVVGNSFYTKPLVKLVKKTFHDGET